MSGWVLRPLKIHPKSAVIPNQHPPQSSCRVTTRSCRPQLFTVINMWLGSPPNAHTHEQRGYWPGKRTLVSRHVVLLTWATDQWYQKPWFPFLPATTVRHTSCSFSPGKIDLVPVRMAHTLCVVFINSSPVEMPVSTLHHAEAYVLGRDSDEGNHTVLTLPSGPPHTGTFNGNGLI